ncbi:protein lethal(2)denticleless isoform X2 [Phymastichus coffea]|uniref:protein lethal(2)denticleless isoform X2 n=1 Tax=Phymastichus coffea TaxID=108790 RepID=UPI00273AE3BF|nr:protein lethal(2)denticleless isoform X2 [Phymastichus coffea]
MKMAHSDAIFDIAWMPQEMKLITASGDHSARLWDVSQEEIKELQIFHAHTRSVKNVAFRPQDKAVFATGARDGAIMIWDIRATNSNRPDNSIYYAHCTKLLSRIKQRRTPLNKFKHNRVQSITGLVFQDDYTLLSCSSGDGLIKVWDLRKNYTTHKKDPIPKYTMNYGGKSNSNGFTSLVVCPYGITLYASCMDNTIYAYNVLSYNPKPIAEYYGHKNSTFYVKACLSPDGKYLASGSSDELAYIWHTKKPGTPLLKLSGHREEVTCIAWCSVGESKIVTCSDDSCHRIWTVGKEHINEDEKINIHGYAEPILQSPMNEAKRNLETTPTLSRLRVNRDCSSESDITPDGDYNIRSVKRNYTQMSSGYWSEGGYKSILSPIQENVEAPLKRPNLEIKGARRLFSPNNKMETHVQNSIRTLNNSCESDEPGPSSSLKFNMSVPFSLTSNLPNFVLDGTAPHLLEMSPRKSKENIDWLTKIRKNKCAKQICNNAEKLSSPKSHVTPDRSTTRSKSTEPRKMPVSPLLQFFKPTIKNFSSDLQN